MSYDSEQPEASTIHIACCFDERMIIGARMLVSSIEEAHAGFEVKLKLHVVTAAGFEFDKAIFLTRQTQNMEFSFYKTADIRIGSVVYSSHLSPATFLRLALADLIDEEKVIYLDCDVIVLQPLSTLYDTDLGSAPLAAVPDYILTHNQSEFRVPHGGIELLPQTYIEKVCKTSFRSYFNAGVLLLNLREWRATSLGREVLTYIEHRKDLFFGDQDALNAVIKEDYIKLDPRWNAISYALLEQAPDDFGNPEWRAVLAAWRTNPWVIHFVGQTKPWHAKAPRTIFDGRAKRFLPQGTTVPASHNLPARIAPQSEFINLPIVSVIVVNFNYGDYLRPCVNSIMWQDYPRVECILVDNCSTDNSAEVIRGLAREFADLKVIARSTNGGQAKAWQDGMRIAQGKYIMFVDADDYLLPESIACHIAVHITLQSSTGFTSSDMVQVEDGQLVVGTYFEAAFSRSTRHVVRIDPRQQRQLNGMSRAVRDLVKVFNACNVPLFGIKQINTDWVWSPTSANLYRADALKLFINIPAFQEFRTNADTFMNFAINSFIGSVLIDRPLAAYRIHGRNSFSRGAALFNLASYDKKNDAAHRGALAVAEYVLTHFEFFAAKSLSNIQVLSALKTLKRIASEYPDKWKRLLYIYTLLRRSMLQREILILRRQSRRRLLEGAGRRWLGRSM